MNYNDKRKKLEQILERTSLEDFEKWLEESNRQSPSTEVKGQQGVEDAELFLKKKIGTYAWGTPFGLNKLPIVLYEEVAKVMAEYAATKPSQPQEVGQDELGWKQEYDAAVNEIGQLQDQLKEAEAYIRELQNELRSSH